MNIKTKYISGKSIGWYHSKVARVIIRIYQKKLSPLGISAPQSGLLYLLYEAEQSGEVLNQSDISQYLFLNKVSTHSLINNLLKKKFIDKVPDKNDRRYNKIKLTAKGKNLIPKLQEVDVQIEKEIYEHWVPSIISDDEFNTLKKLLEHTLHIDLQKHNTE